MPRRFPLLLIILACLIAGGLAGPGVAAAVSHRSAGALEAGRTPSLHSGVRTGEATPPGAPGADSGTAAAARPSATRNSPPARNLVFLQVRWLAPPHAHCPAKGGRILPSCLSFTLLRVEYTGPAAGCDGNGSRAEGSEARQTAARGGPAGVNGRSGGHSSTFVTSLLHEHGFVLCQYRYDSFGNQLGQCINHYIAPDGTIPCLMEQPFRFSTKWLDQTDGLQLAYGPHPKNRTLYYYGYRYYSPQQGRWLGRDPIGEQGGVNLFGMVGNEVVSLFDVLGLRPTVQTALVRPNDNGTTSSILLVIKKDDGSTEVVPMFQQICSCWLNDQRRAEALKQQAIEGYETLQGLNEGIAKDQKSLGNVRLMDPFGIGQEWSQGNVARGFGRLGIAAAAIYSGGALAAGAAPAGAALGAAPSTAAIVATDIIAAGVGDMMLQGGNVACGYQQEYSASQTVAAMAFGAVAGGTQAWARSCSCTCGEMLAAGNSAGRVRHYTSPELLAKIKADRTLLPSREKDGVVGVHVETGPPFGPVRTGAAETGAYGKGAYVEFDAPSPMKPTKAIGPRKTAVIPTDQPLPITDLNPRFQTVPWWKFWLR